MTFEEFERAARRTVNARLSDRDRLLDAAMGLAEEASEVAGLVRKRVLQQRPVEDARLVEELGDTLWCLATVADSLGVSLEHVARSNIAKLQARYPGNDPQ
jgi:NTP pyrophosphatase (non-canonical NTP hydrolase)